MKLNCMSHLTSHMVGTWNGDFADDNTKCYLSKLTSMNAKYSYIHCYISKKSDMKKKINILDKEEIMRSADEYFAEVFKRM